MPDEASPEIHIEDVFEKLYEEKDVNPTKELYQCIQVSFSG